MDRPFVEREFELGDDSKVTVRLFQPVPDRGDFRCDYEIAWPDNVRKSHSFGVDAVQALILAMETAHVDLLASPQSKDGHLTWLGMREFHLPLPANVKPEDFA